MLKGGFSFSYRPDLLDAKHHMVYAHVGNFQAEAQADERIAVPEDLEYIFQLIRSHFLCVVPMEECYPAIPDNGVNIHLYALGVLSLPFTSETDKSQIGLWNDIVNEVSYEYGERMKPLLRGKCTGKQLYELVQDCIEDFEYEDRERLDANKLANLAAFVFDFCMLTMKEAHLYRNLDLYMDGKVMIRDKEFVAPLRCCAEIRQYCINGGIVGDGKTWISVDYDLPTVQLAPTVQNPHANDSYISAMFVDLMHKFFLSFGLKKFGKSEWSAPERWLIYELLRLFGLCKSNKPAKETKYVTTVLRDYGAYFTKCNLRSWLREEQAYSYLMCCTPEQFTGRGQVTNEPFLPLENYAEVKETAPVKEETSWDAQVLQNLLSETAGHSYVITHTKYGQVSYASVVNKDPVEAEKVEWDPRLDYVMMLVMSSFEYISFFPNYSQYIVMRQDLADPKILQKLVSSLEKDLLERMDAIPREFFTPDDVMPIIKSFRGHLATKDERLRTDIDKLYVLFLFIFDYVFLTYKESVVNPYLRMYVPSTLSVCGKQCPSTMLRDDMLSMHLGRLFTFTHGENETDVYENLRKPDLYVPDKNFSVEHPSCTVKNMTAMFFDLFVRFFKTFGLTKRPDVKFVSDQESTFIGELAICSGICSAKNPASARAMFMTNQDYFKKSSLEVAIRENEYGYLLLNTMSEELFGPKTQADK